MSILEFSVPGVAVGKSSPQFSVHFRKGQRCPVCKRSMGKPFVRIYYTDRTDAWMKLVKICAKKIAPPEPWTCAIRLTIEVFVEPAPSWPASKWQAALQGKIYPTSKPDWDNYAKGVCDPLNKMVWKDDSQVVDGRVIIKYAAKAVTKVTIEALGDTSTQMELL